MGMAPFCRMVRQFGQHRQFPVRLTRLVWRKWRMSSFCVTRHRSPCPRQNIGPVDTLICPRSNCGTYGIDVPPSVLWLGDGSRDDPPAPVVLRENDVLL